MVDENDEYSDDSLFNITSWGADMTFRELASMYEEGELRKPEFQRNYVWTKLEASRFIESILLGLPVPSIFLANASGNEKLIIDGYQRIMTIYDYIAKKKFASEELIFKLVNSPRINIRWRNKSFEELPLEDQRKLRSSTIHAIIFEQKSPKEDDTSMFQIFSRINTSGRTLNAQEIRNCVCQGEFNSLLIKLNQNEKWRQLYGSSLPDSRMRDLELILRFFAIRDISKIDSSKKQINLRKYLDLYMQSCPVDSLGHKYDDFIKMIDFVLENMGEAAFTSMMENEGGRKGKINPTIFDAISVASDAYIKRGVGSVSDLMALRRALLQDEEFNAVIRYRTTNVSNIEARIAIAKRILYNIVD